MTEAAIADAGPIIHLDELSYLSLLNCYNVIWVPKTVAEEAEKYRPGWLLRGPDSMREVEVPRADVEDFRRSLKTALDDGEIESLALWKRLSSASVICDDLAARRVAKELGAPIIGTLGIIIKGAKQDRITLSTAIELIRSIPEATTLHVSRDLLEYAVCEIQRSLENQL